ncbi:hypothetical protein B0T22DRAFT_7525 [Podospora appendiculata]|uniref:Secreted protein n=1 Tax=Podospora appendiculata TaxID=314037 RepID=A0AAE0XEZ7_9PEZI|nr:hypothetical protein B0T22DRAFT_7525 [Podospora appendiculata]
MPRAFCVSSASLLLFSCLISSDDGKTLCLALVSPHCILLILASCWFGQSRDQDRMRELSWLPVTVNNLTEFYQYFVPVFCAWGAKSCNTSNCDQSQGSRFHKTIRIVES